MRRTLLEINKVLAPFSSEQDGIDLERIMTSDPLSKLTPAEADLIWYKKQPAGIVNNDKNNTA